MKPKGGKLALAHTLKEYSPSHEEGRHGNRQLGATVAGCPGTSFLTGKQETGLSQEGKSSYKICRPASSSDLLTSKQPREFHCLPTS